MAQTKTRFKIANCMLALAGDSGNTVPKRGVTAGEIVVLMALHGQDAVTDVEVLGGSEPRSARAEFARLQERYPSVLESTGGSLVRKVFPHPDNIPFEFEGIGIPEDSFKSHGPDEDGDEDEDEETQTLAAAKPKPKPRAKKPAAASTSSVLG